MHDDFLDFKNERFLDASIVGKELAVHPGMQLSL
jgi:hypothetical protein